MPSMQQSSQDSEECRDQPGTSTEAPMDPPEYSPSIMLTDSPEHSQSRAISAPGVAEFIAEQHEAPSTSVDIQDTSSSLDHETDSSGVTITTSDVHQVALPILAEGADIDYNQVYP